MSLPVNSNQVTDKDLIKENGNAEMNRAPCSYFDPQTWRPKLCKNCFKNVDEHDIDSEEMVNGEEGLKEAAQVAAAREKKAKTRTSITENRKDRNNWKAMGMTPLQNNAGLTTNETEYNKKGTQISTGSRNVSTKMEEPFKTNKLAKWKSEEVLTKGSLKIEKQEKMSGEKETKESSDGDKAVKQSKFSIVQSLGKTFEGGGGPKGFGQVYHAKTLPHKKPSKLTFNIDKFQVNSRKDDINKSKGEQKSSVTKSEDNKEANAQRAARESVIVPPSPKSPMIRKAEAEAEMSRLLSEKEGISNKLKNAEESTNRLREQIRGLEEQNTRPESDRFTYDEDEYAKLKSELSEKEKCIQELSKENTSLKQCLIDLEIEVDEMRDQFRSEEAEEFHEIQKELEQTAKTCRILQFRLRKAERKNEQVEADRQEIADKIKDLEYRYRNAEETQHLCEIEQELRMARQTASRYNDELELMEERRSNYEEENERLKEQVRDYANKLLRAHKEIDILRAELAAIPKTQLTAALQELENYQEREQDLMEQLKYAEDSTRQMRKRLRDLDVENESLVRQLKKMSTSSKKKYSNRRRHTFDINNELDELDDNESETVELRLQLGVTEQETTVLRKKLKEMEQDNDNMLCEVKFLQERLAEMAMKPIEQYNELSERVEQLTQSRDSITKSNEALRTQLLDKDYQIKKLEKEKAKNDTRNKAIRHSVSLESGYQIDVTKQLEMVQREAQIMREKLMSVEDENDKVTAENRALRILNTRLSKEVKSKKDKGGKSKLKRQMSVD